MRLMLFAAPWVCKVESTRCPVSAADSAVLNRLGVTELTRSRITLGVLTQHAAQRLGEKIPVSAPTSRWWTRERLLSW